MRICTAAYGQHFWPVNDIDVHLLKPSIIVCTLPGAVLSISRFGYALRVSISCAEYLNLSDTHISCPNGEEQYLRYKFQLCVFC